jgi:hypothetical protein
MDDVVGVAGFVGRMAVQFGPERFNMTATDVFSV